MPGRSLDYAAGHIPGSLSIELRPVFATWLGWLVDASRPVVFVLDDDQDRHELVRQCLTVGVESLAGELAGGYDDLGDRRASRRVDQNWSKPAGLDGTTVLDVRQHDEFLAGHVPGARNIELGALPSADNVPSGHLVVMCGHGERAMTGASVLAHAGHRDLAVLIGGPD